jgi:hypothetical protein
MIGCDEIQARFLVCSAVFFYGGTILPAASASLSTFNH